MRKLKTIELKRPTVDQYKKIQKLPIIVVLDNVRSSYNVGSVFRSADAFLIKAIYLCGITARPPHREIHKTALGAIESVDWKYYENTEQAVGELKKESFRIIAIEQADGSSPLNSFEFKRLEKLAIILGNEVTGVGESVMKHADDCIEIPQEGTKHSLNISVSAGVVMWELFKRYKTL